MCPVHFGSGLTPRPVDHGRLDLEELQQPLARDHSLLDRAVEGPKKLSGPWSCVRYVTSAAKSPTVRSLRYFEGARHHRDQDPVMKTIAWHMFIWLMPHVTLASATWNFLMASPYRANSGPSALKYLTVSYDVMESFLTASSSRSRVDHIAPLISSSGSHAYGQVGGSRR